MKDCSSCKQEKPRSEFYKSPTRVDGLRDECKQCTSDRNRARRGYFKARRKERFTTDPEFRKKYSSRHEKDKVKDRARQRTRYYVKTGKIEKLACAMCGNPETVPHHEDYNDVFNVIWFCQLHHRHYHLGEFKVEASVVNQRLCDVNI